MKCSHMHMYECVTLQAITFYPISMEIFPTQNMVSELQLLLYNFYINLKILLLNSLLLGE